jgi:hypothetical protein
MPIGAPLKPASSPAREAASSGFSSMAAMTWARWTIRIGALRDFARRLISCSSSLVKVRSLIRFGILSSFTQENNFNLFHEKTTKLQEAFEGK